MEIDSIFAGMSNWADEPLTLELVINDHTTAVALNEEQQVIIGRTDPRLGFVPDIDLLPYDARRHGVSREHITLFQREGRPYIIDMDSENGTYLNNMLLTPGAAHAVFSGDTLRLGLLFVQVRY